MKTPTVYQTLLVLSLVSLLGACGGGGGGGSDDTPAAPATGSGTVAASGSDGGTVTGGVTKGPVNGATVLFYVVDQFGFPLDTEIATATTDASGSFTVTLPEGTGTVLVESFGGSYIDESDQGGNRVIQLGANDGFSSILPNGSISVAINPITDSLVLRSRILSDQAGGFGGNFNTTRAAFSDETGFDAFTTVPSNPTSPAVDASETEKQYALMLGGLANAINSVTVELGLGAPTYEVIRAVTLDLVDGELDGLKFGVPIEVDGTNGIVNLATDIDFDAEVNRFRNNNADVYEGTPAPAFDFSFFANTAPTAIAIATPSPATPNLLVTLDGSSSFDGGSIASYQWAQTQGTPVVLDNPTSVTPTFIAPDSNLTEGESLEFTLTVTDNQGDSAQTILLIDAGPVLPLEFFSLEEFVPPFQFGVDVGSGERVNLFSDNTGQILYRDGTQSFQWSDTNNVLTLDFSSSGGLVLSESISFEDVDNDTIQEEIRRSSVVDSFEYTLVIDTAGLDTFTRRELGNENEENFTDLPGVVVASPFDRTLDQTLVDFDFQTPFDIQDGEIRSLLVGVTSQQPNVQEPASLDQLTFSADGTGSSRFNLDSFTWLVDADGHLRVVFDTTGDFVDYYHLFSKDSGDVVAAILNATGAGSSLSFTDDASIDWVARSASVGLAGIYETDGRFELTDGTFVSETLYYRINADGTGVLELPQTDVVTGEITSWFASSNGICWAVNAQNDFVWVRASTIPGFGLLPTPPRFPGDRTPNPSDCLMFDFDLKSDSANTAVTFRRDQTLFDTNAIGELRTTAESLSNPDFGVGADLETNSFFSRLFRFTPFNGVAIVAVPDFVLASEGVAIPIDVLTNDIPRPSASVTVEIIAGPSAGAAIVNGLNQIEYTSDIGAELDPGFDTIYYRVIDDNGNESTFGQVDISFSIGLM